MSQQISHDSQIKLLKHLRTHAGCNIGLNDTLTRISIKAEYKLSLSPGDARTLATVLNKYADQAEKG